MGTSTYKHHWPLTRPTFSTLNSLPPHPAARLPTLQSSLGQTLLYLGSSSPKATSSYTKSGGGDATGEPRDHPRRAGRAGPLLCEDKHNLSKREFSLVPKEKDILLPFLSVFLHCNCESFPRPFEKYVNIFKS